MTLPWISTCFTTCCTVLRPRQFSSGFRSGQVSCSEKETISCAKGFRFRKPDLESRDSPGFYTSSAVQATVWLPLSYIRHHPDVPENPGIHSIGSQTFPARNG